MMNLKETLSVKMDEFLQICLAYNVKKIHAFGSSINEKFNEESSDIDLLIEMEDQDPLKRGENLIDIWDKLELFFQRKVDLLSESSIKNPILRKSIDATKVLVYDRKKQKVFI